MGKWIKTDPATLKVGDEVRMVDAFSMFQISGKTSPSKIGICVGGIDFTEAPECRTWYVRKPKPAKPLTRPDEPPIGTFFRVERTGETYWHHYPLNGTAYWHLVPYTGNGVSPEWHCWERITEPGDTITLLELTEKGDKKDGGV